YRVSLDGAALVAAGTSPQTFSGLTAISHSVRIVDANNCEITRSITVGQPPALTLTLTKVDVSCNGGSDGSVTATFGGGIAPYQLKVDGGAFAAATSPATLTGLSSGSHTVVVKDANGCQQTASASTSTPSCGQLTPTNVTCSQFTSGTAPDL